MDLSAKTSLRLVVFAFILVCMNHLSVLSSWSMTQYLFSYDNGLQRRALAGEMVSWLLTSGQTAAQIQAIGLLVTFAGGLILLAIMLRDVLPVRGGGAVVIGICYVNRVCDDDWQHWLSRGFDDCGDRRRTLSAVDGAWRHFARDTLRHRCLGS